MVFDVAQGYDSVTPAMNTYNLKRFRSRLFSVEAHLQFSHSLL